MKVIGITGRMGSGKTTLGNDMSQYMNIPIFDCDTAAKTAYNDKTIQSILKSEYGNSVVSGGVVNKSKLAHIIFNVENEMKFIQRLVTPFINLEYERFIQKCLDFKLFVIGVESAKLLEMPFRNLCDIILVKTTGDDQINISRSQSRIAPKYISEEEVKRRLAKQMSERQMLEFAKTREIKDYTDFYNNVRPYIDSLI